MNREIIYKDFLALSRDLAIVVKQIEEKNLELKGILSQIELSREELRKVRELHQPLIESLNKKIQEIKEEISTAELEKNALGEKYKNELLEWKKKIELAREKFNSLKKSLELAELKKTKIEEEIRVLLRKEIDELINIIYQETEKMNREFENLMSKKQNIEDLELKSERMFSLLKKGLKSQQN